MAVRVQTEDFDSAAELRIMCAGNRHIGAVASFVGLVRDRNDGDAVAELFLEHYPGMTEKALEEIVAQAHARWNILDALVIHRVGAMRPGDQIVLVHVAGSHRGEAFAACEFIMDYLKTEAPFWKKEQTPEGARWVDARESDDAARRRWHPDAVAGHAHVAAPGDVAIRHAAEIIAANRLGRGRLASLPELWRPRDENAAYAIQDALHDVLSGQGLGELSGHKIGCTTPVMQAFLGIHNPCAGGVFAATVQHGQARLLHAGFVHVGVECEIAVRLKDDLPPRRAPFDRARVAAAVGECMAAMEIVDDRYADYRTMDTPTLIADDFFDAGCVLGPPVRDWDRLDLTALSGVTRINGVEAGRGVSAAVMGHPFEALAWLANQLAVRGRGLKAGEFVLTGSIVETRWVAAGDEVVIGVEGLGEVRATFT